LAPVGRLLVNSVGGEPALGPSRVRKKGRLGV
jgi:hypothetical protein